jgi:hypothetical protein
MFVERGDYLNSLRTVMYLMKEPPQRIIPMPPPMPPIKDKCGNEISNHASNSR